jgi:hypothetical protein
MKFSVAGLAFGLLMASSAFGQLVISAHSGVVQYVEGRAYLDGTLVELKFGHFPDIKQNQEFRTEEGRAEILLTPGVFLRLGENSGIRMLSNGLTDTRVEVLNGSAIVECDQLPKDNSIMLVYKDASIALLKHGLYRVDTEPARLQVFDGEATVTGESGQITLKAGKQTDLGSALLAQNFDKNGGDELYRWANRRASYVAQANVSSASAFNTGSYGYGYGSGYGYGGYGYGYTGTGLLGGWNWNPMYGLFTWVPLAGVGYSPFGYAFWSPVTVFNAPFYNSGFYGGGLQGGGFYGRRSPAMARSGIGARSTSFGTASYGPSAEIRGGGGMGSSGTGSRGGGGSFGGGHAGGGFGGGHAGGGGGHGR